MEYICSDTNIWIDFWTIGKIELPFMLDFTFIMYKESIDDELLNPPELASTLVNLGLEPTTINTEELIRAQNVISSHKKLSIHDAIAFSIAKTRQIPLLTGDRRLREFAIQNNVHVLGSIGIIDLLYDSNSVPLDVLLSCLKDFHRLNGGKIRLPRTELDRRIVMLESIIA